ncbi:MAG: hypothetical protein PV340_02080 [Wolbachia sp.]|nr:hypothetical protein [Wolbachia sp.]MDD9335997.1 hypothetical protein [Wolbachia sp.]
MSTSLIVNIAFCVGFILSYNLLKKIIKKVLKKKRTQDEILDQITNSFTKDAVDHYRKFLKEYNELDARASALLKGASSQAAEIMKYKMHELEKTLDGKMNSNAKQASEQIKKAVGDIKANTASVAANTVKKMMNEYKDDKHKVISSLSRDLNKKLH